MLEIYEDVSYPYVFSIVCTRWRIIAHETPSLWSYISITDSDDSTLDDISLSLQRSKSFPLSIRVTVFSQMSKMDRLEVRTDRMTSQWERLKSQMERPGAPDREPGEPDGLESLETQLGTSTRLASFGSDSKLKPIPIADETVDLDPLAQFEEQISLLLRHIGQWRLFHIVAAQPPFHPPALRHCSLRWTAKLRFSKSFTWKPLGSVNRCWISHQRKGGRPHSTVPYLLFKG